MPRPPESRAEATETPPRLTDRLFAWAQHLLPHHALSRLVLAATRLRAGWLKNVAIRLFIRHFKVDMQQAAQPDYRAYPHFNAFFTRALRPDARPIDAGTANLISPADATVSQLGAVQEGRIFQAKGHHYSAEALLASSEQAKLFHDGSFATLYLSPRDYHRVHMPFGGRLLATTYVPGRLFSVNPATTRAVPGLFARNERVVSLFETEQGPIAVVLVGALFVGCMETAWQGIITPPHGHRVLRTDYRGRTPAVALAKGEELGRFNMGSTVIVLTGHPLRWTPGLDPATPVRTGQLLGQFTPGS